MCGPRVRLGHGGVFLAAWLVVGCGEEFEPTSGSPGDGAHCNGPGALADDFEDGVLSDAFKSRTYGDGMVVEESGGALVFAPADAGGSGSREARYAIDLRGSFTVVQVPEVGGGLLGKTVSMLLKQGDTKVVTMVASADPQNVGSELLRFEVTDSDGSTKNSTAYDPAAHRWWRFGEQNGVLSFGASPDGAEWTTYHEVPAPSFLQAGTLMLATSDNAKVLPIGQIRFDDLNPQGGAFCGIDRLSESFDQALGEGWVEYKDNDCVGTAAGGAFEATVPAGGSGQCSITTRHGYDLQGRGITLALGELPASAPGTGVSLSLTSGDSDRLTLEHRQGKLTATSLLGSATSTGSLDLGAGPAWWRIREAKGRVEFELSADGKTFQSVHSVIVDSLPARFLVSLRIYVNQAQSGTTRLAVDAIN